MVCKNTVILSFLNNIIKSNLLKTWHLEYFVWCRAKYQTLGKHILPENINQQTCHSKDKQKFLPLAPHILHCSGGESWTCHLSLGLLAISHADIADLSDKVKLFWNWVSKAILYILSEHAIGLGQETLFKQEKNRVSSFH